jgi:hypothetical protein
MINLVRSLILGVAVSFSFLAVAEVPTDTQILTKVARDEKGIRLVSSTKDQRFPITTITYKADIVTLDPAIAGKYVTLSVGTVKFPEIGDLPVGCVAKQYYQIMLAPETKTIDLRVGLEGESCEGVTAKALESDVEVVFSVARTGIGEDFSPLKMFVQK